jgi:CII-binding regulator of phage lambda lysogenization HflD
VSIALGQTVKRLELELLEISRALTDSQALIKALEQRISALENKPKPGPKPRNG